MAKLPEPKDPTLEAVEQCMEISMNTAGRGHLGASQIGDPCSRKLWYSFRWALQSAFKAATLARFDDGHRSEAIMAERLRWVKDLDLWTEMDDGSQFGFTDHGGHFAGSVDGVIKGLIQAPKTPHIWEHKCTNEKKFAQLEKLKLEKGEKDALAHWDPIYYSQAQVYMHYFELKRHYLTCATAGTRDVTSVRTDYNPTHALALVSKAEQIIASDAPPTRLTERKDDHRCKWCAYIEQCHYDRMVAANCRTCRHSKPIDGGWECGLHSVSLDLTEQYLGCADHQPIDGLKTLEDAA